EGDVRRGGGKRCGELLDPDTATHGYQCIRGGAVRDAHGRGAVRGRPGFHARAGASAEPREKLSGAGSKAQVAAHRGHVAAAGGNPGGGVPSREMDRRHGPDDHTGGGARGRALPPKPGAAGAAGHLHDPTAREGDIRRLVRLLAGRPAHPVSRPWRRWELAGLGAFTRFSGTASTRRHGRRKHNLPVLVARQPFRRLSVVRQAEEDRYRGRAPAEPLRYSEYASGRLLEVRWRDSVRE